MNKDCEANTIEVAVDDVLALIGGDSSSEGRRQRTEALERIKMALREHEGMRLLAGLVEALEAELADEVAATDYVRSWVEAARRHVEIYRGSDCG